MKRRVVILTLALAASLALSACASSPEPTGAPSATAQATNDAGGQIEPEDTAAPESRAEQSAADENAAGEQVSNHESGAANSSALGEYAALMRDMLDALSEVYGDAMSIEVSTQGDSTLIITYRLLDDTLGLSAEAIAQSMEAEGDKMINQAELMHSNGISSPEVIVKWIDTDGSELFSSTYTLP